MNTPLKSLRLRLTLAILIGSVVFGLAAGVAGATTYYVSPSGADSNPGVSVQSPWQSLDKVNATTLNPGDQVLFEGGQTFKGELDPNGSGAADAPTVYGSYGSGKAIISGQPATYPTGVSYVTYRNLILDGANSGDCVRDYGGPAATHITFESDEIRNCVFGINQSRASDAYWTVENSYVHDTSDSGIVITGPEHTPNGGHFVIRDNRIENTGTSTTAPSSADAHGIYDDSPGSQIVGNDIGHFQTDGISLRYRNATVTGNTIHDGTRTTCCSMGIAYYNYDVGERPGEGTSTISGNRISGVPYGVNITNEGNNGAANGPENWVISGNSIIGSKGAGSALGTLIQYASGTTGTQLAIERNVLLGQADHQLYVGRTPASYTEVGNAWTATGDAYRAGATTPAQTSAASSATKGSGINAVTGPRSSGSTRHSLSTRRIAYVAANRPGRARGHRSRARAHHRRPARAHHRRATGRRAHR